MMSEMEEEVTLDHFIHEHPLSLIQSDKEGQCRGCFRRFTKEAAYGCKKCGDEKMLHQECAEMPRKIMHPKHPQHTLVQQRGDGSRHCALCGNGIHRIGYFCSISPMCEFQVHLVCAPAKGMKHVDDQRISVMHPSHPEHELILVKKRLSFKCDACGTMETGRSYQCFSCQYLIHEQCAALPATAGYHHHHYHPLSLAFYLPIEYIKFWYKCDVCNKEFFLNSWVYHCELCRFVVHIKCAIGPSLSPTAKSEDANEADSRGLIRFPINEPHEEIIKPFVIRERGEMSMPGDDQKHWFSNHHHQLSLVSSSSISEINDDEQDDDDDDLNFGKIETELICDACTMPIFQKQKHDPSSSSSSSSSSEYKNCNYYMSCGECKYFLHLACFHLPPELPSHSLLHLACLHLPPKHPSHPLHKLILKAFPNFWVRCSICRLLSDGLFYRCTECNFKADIKCASLPNTIQHEAHPHHHLHSNFISLNRDSKMIRQGICGGCRYIIYGGIFYKCRICDFVLCSNCVFLPPTNKHDSDKHPLPLRYDANLDHPDDFYCDECEREMDPKAWMYHCRGCDTSFHPKCFLATSGAYRNIKFGQQYRVAAAIHPHPLTFQLLTTKLRCDLCRLRIYGEEHVEQHGFHCSSCNFFVCFKCARSNGLRAID